jgi:hypothetical protein
MKRSFPVINQVMVMMQLVMQMQTGRLLLLSS